MGLAAACAQNDANPGALGDDAGALADRSVDAPLEASSPTDSGAAVDADAGALGCTAGSPIAAVIASMAPGSWKSLPNTKMKDVCPTPYYDYFCSGVMVDWSGGTFDSLRDRLIVSGGGHAGSPYNNVYTFDLPSMTWKRWTDLPAGISGPNVPAAYTDPRFQSCALYPKDAAALDIPDAMLVNGSLPYAACSEPAIASQLDPQQPRADHTYGNLAFSVATGKFYHVGSSALFVASGGSPRNEVFDFTTGLWSQGADNVKVTIGGLTASDAAGRFYYVSQNDISVYDAVADRWTVAPSPDDNAYYYGGADVDETRNRLVTFAGATNGTFYTYDLPDVTTVTKKVGANAAALGSAPGFVYVKSVDRFVAWSGGATVFFLDPTTFAWKSLDGTGDVPAAQSMWGTYGRMQYSEKCDVMVVANAVDQDVAIYRMPTMAP